MRAAPEQPLIFYFFKIPNTVEKLSCLGTQIGVSLEPRKEKTAFIVAIDAFISVLVVLGL